MGEIGVVRENSSHVIGLKVLKDFSLDVVCCFWLVSG